MPHYVLAVNKRNPQPSPVIDIFSFILFLLDSRKYAYSSAVPSIQNWNTRKIPKISGGPEDPRAVQGSMSTVAQRCAFCAQGVNFQKIAHVFINNIGISLDSKHRLIAQGRGVPNVLRRMSCQGCPNAMPTSKAGRIADYPRGRPK